MLKELTSLWDYFHKCEEDKAYEEVAIRGYKSDTYNPPPYTFEMAKAWLEKWIIDNVKAEYEETCIGMVNYLNRQIRQINVRAHTTEVARQLREREAQRMGQTIQEAIETQRQQAQMTGQPIITAQQRPPPRATDWITTMPFTVRYAPINPTFYGTITIDNEGARVNNPNNPPAPPPATPPPPTENLWGDIPEPPGHPDNPVGQTLPRPGQMTEYGWYDQEIEDEINALRATTGIAREDAIICVFNNDRGATLLTAERQPGDMRPANTLVDENDYEIEEMDWEDMTLDTPPEDDPREER